MMIIKIITLFGIIVVSFLIGELISKRYIFRVKELKEIKNALNMFKTKIKFTYEPIGEIFSQIAVTSSPSIKEIFLNASNKMEELTAGEAWVQAIDECDSNLKRDDLEVLKGLYKLLGKTDINGQLSEIELTSTFLDKQIEDAQMEETKNVKMYKTLGIVFGLMVVIILV